MNGWWLGVGHRQCVCAWADRPSALPDRPLTSPDRLLSKDAALLSGVASHLMASNLHLEVVHTTADGTSPIEGKGDGSGSGDIITFEQKNIKASRKQVGLLADWLVGV